MTRVEVTLLGFELEIVGRKVVDQPPPPQLRVPILKRWHFTTDGSPPTMCDWQYAEYRYEGSGTYTYRRFR